MNTSQPDMNSLPDGDLELLSGYIDNQLGPAERAKLERRLGVEPRLRAELEDLRTTASVLRSLEPLRPPRSFTLSPATATRRRGILALAWAMQLGGGLVGLALVLMASLQMFSSMGGSMAAASAPTMEPVVAQVPTMMVAAAPLVAVGAPASTSAPAPAAVRQGDPAGESTANDSGGASQVVGAAAVVPSADIAAGVSAAAVTQSPATPALPLVRATPPQPSGAPDGLAFSLGVALLALALGTFIYTRR